ncbi:MAG: glycosyltransferase [Pseudomonadota bacterium]
MTMVIDPRPGVHLQAPAGRLSVDADGNSGALTAVGRGRRDHIPRGLGIRILHVIASLALKTGGPAVAARGMAGALARLGHEVAIHTTDREMGAVEAASLAAEMREAGVELKVYRQHFPAVFATSLPLARGLGEAIPRVDLVHLHSLYLFHDWAAARACRRHGVPYLLRPHGSLDPYLWRRHRLRKRAIELAFQNRVIRAAAALHFTAAEEMRLAQPYCQGTAGVVIPNGLALADYADLPPPGGLRRAFPEIGARRIVLFLGRLNFKKGLDLLIPAFARAVLSAPDLHLVIAGPDDGMKRRTVGWIAEAGIAARVTFTGLIEGRAKLAAFRDAACFVLPSYSENFGLAVVEAMACSVPVAITEGVNIWREVAGAGAGLVGPPSVDAVAAQIAELVHDPARAAAMGERGKALVAANFAWERIARDLESVYRSLAARREPRPSARG